jgi:hypothetical protein
MMNMWLLRHSDLSEIFMPICKNSFSFLPLVAEFSSAEAPKWRGRYPETPCLACSVQIAENAFDHVIWLMFLFV